MQKPRSSVIILIIIMTTILAIATSLALFALQGRPDPSEEPVPQSEQTSTETRIINVEGVDIIIPNNPESQLFIQPVTSQPENTASEQPAQETQQTQEQPAEQQTEQTQEQPTQQTEQVQEQQPAQATAVPAGTVNRNVASIIFQNYRVKADDTLYNITRQLNTSVTLMAVHGIDQDDLIVDKEISIPVGNPAYCPGMQPYAIGEGDTVFSIAQRRNTTKETLRTINGLDAEYSIFAGTIICVP